MTEQVTERTGDSLCSLVDLWDIVSDTLGITTKQAADFVEQKFEANKSAIWTEAEHTGLWKPYSGNKNYLLDAWNDGENNNWTGDYIHKWKFLKLTPKEFRAIENGAIRIKERSNSEQSTSPTPEQGDATTLSKGMDELFELGKEQRREVEWMIELLALPQELASEGLSAVVFIGMEKLTPSINMGEEGKYRTRFEKLCHAVPHVSPECLRLLGFAFVSVSFFLLEKPDELNIRQGALHLMNTSMALGGATALLPASVGFLSAKVQAERQAMLSKAGLLGAESRNKPYAALKSWAIEKAGGMRGAHKDIADRLAAQLPAHLANASKDPARLIYDALRTRKT